MKKYDFHRGRKMFLIQCVSLDNASDSGSVTPFSKKLFTNEHNKCLHELDS